MKVLIVGGVAGGASAAARLRRVAEDAEIILFERGAYISYANCGLPYYVGDVITEREDLLLQTPEGFRDRYAVDVRVEHEVLSIDRERHTVEVRDLVKNRVYSESYDKLILSPGAEPRRPDLPGIALPQVFTLRSIPDAYRIRDFIDARPGQSAVVIGGGFIGVEMAENLAERGVDTTLVEFTDQIIASIDPDMACQLHRHMISHGLKLVFETGAKAFEEMPDGRVAVILTNDNRLQADFVIFAIGVAPDSRLAREAGLKLGIGGSIAVDETMRTSDPDIYAVGDAVQVHHLVHGQPALIPLAGPANKQGRVAADAIAGRNSTFGAVQGTAVLKVFDLTCAGTGLNEKQLLKAGIRFEKIHIHPLHHAGYYPGAEQISFKLMFDPVDGRLLGAQGIGRAGVEKRIDVLAAAMRLGATVFDLETLELCYAPPYSSAKDPVNMLGFIAGNIIRGDVRVFHADQAVQAAAEGVLIDVRTPAEFAQGALGGAINIPLDELRSRLDELPRDKPLFIYCRVGMRGYLACRILTQKGFADVRNLSGGYLLFCSIRDGSAHAVQYDCWGQPLPPRSSTRSASCV